MTRRVVSVLVIVFFHTCGYKSEAIMAFGASRNREKKGQKRRRPKKGRIFGSEPLATRFFGKCFGYAELLATRI